MAPVADQHADAVALGGEPLLVRDADPVEHLDLEGIATETGGGRPSLDLREQRDVV